MIFISHRSQDEDRALLIKRYFKKKHGIDSFCALYSPRKNTKLDIASWIVDRLNSCSHVVAVFSLKTAGSMWVPFELGAAYQAKKKIGTFIFGCPEVPSYLKVFPLMRTKSHLDQYASLYKETWVLSKSVKEVIRNSTISDANSFIRRLKARLD